MPRTEADEPRISEGVAELLGTALPDAVGLTVSGVARVFGGNARRAWSATASWTDADGGHTADLILLVRLSGSQVRTDPADEIRHLTGLAEQGVRAPRVWAHDGDGHLFGMPAVLLQRMAGRGDAVEYLRADPELGRARTLDLARAAAELHAASPSTGPYDPGAQLEQWRSQFLASRLEPHPALGWLLDWLTDHQPAIERTVVVHGDFRVGNVLYDGPHITGLLDWEMAHLGDAAEDLAWAYRALWSPVRFCSIEDFVAAYADAGGAAIPADSLRWHRVFSEVKFAAISLAAARSLVDGTSTNLRLADRARTVVPAVNLCLSWIAAAEQTARSEAGAAC
ncbi:phosphotransferase family protein [Sporichthya sp.]|uniref:phosphotransferase family protein n=1 Tax=Sporichthya sp. TaxID=65475 RepID=UPI00179B1956|nr:phosphotransferase family protein [Sporichthya sp.]MBA3742806.1 phosphotransferase family protein [Sporichthya sp.]